MIVAKTCKNKYSHARAKVKIKHAIQCQSDIIMRLHPGMMMQASIVRQLSPRVSQSSPRENVMENDAQSKMDWKLIGAMKTRKDIPGPEDEFFRNTDVS